MARKKKSWALTEFHTVKRIDNSRIVRHVEPMKMRRLYRTVALSSVIAAFFMLYIYQHFRCIDLSFQLEDVKGRQAEAVSLNSSLKLEIAGLRNPMRIDVIARRQLGLTEPLPTQVQEYEAPDGAEVAGGGFVRGERAPQCFLRAWVGDQFFVQQMNFYAGGLSFFFFHSPKPRPPRRPWAPNRGCRSGHPRH